MLHNVLFYDLDISHHEEGEVCSDHQRAEEQWVEKYFEGAFLLVFVFYQLWPFFTQG